MIVDVRNLRIAVLSIRNTVTVIILIRDVRILVTISIQLELSLHLIGGLIRVGHRDRNLKLLRGVLVQLQLIRERHRNLTGGLVDLNDVALRSSEVLTNSELRTLRNLYILTILISKGRRRLRFLTRNNQLVFVLRLNGVCGEVRYLEGCVSARDNTGLGLRVTVLVLDRVAVLVENWNLESLVTHHNWEVERLTSLVSVRREGHDTGRRVNRDLVLSDALRQLAELELCLFRLGLLRPGFWVVKLRLRGSLFVCLGIDRVVLEVITRDCKSVQRENQVVLRVWIAVSNLQASSERVTGLGIRWNLELAARDHGCGVSLTGFTRLDDLAVLVDPLDVVAQVIGDRKASSIGLDLITEVGPVVSGVLVDNIELQGLRSKRDVPAGVAVSGVTDERAVTTEELRVCASIQVSTETRASPLAKGPRIQRADVVRKRLAVLAVDADVAPVHIDVLGVRKTVSPVALAMGTCELAELVCRHESTRLVVVTVETLPAQLKLTVSAGGGGQGFCDPAFWIRRYLLINPLLQTLLINRGPALATQRLACEVALRVRLNLVHRVIGEIGANNLHASGRNVLTSIGAHGVVVLTAL